MEKVTPKQLEILILLYRFRFLNRKHIQRILNHKDYKTINAWLKDLTNRNIVARKYENKLLLNNKPAIYCLATKSRKILLNQPKIKKKLLDRVYSDKNRSSKLIDHYLVIADIYIHLLDKSNDKLSFFTKVDLVNHYYLPSKKPDAYIAIKGKQTKRYFLKIIDEETPRFIIRSEITSYFEYADDSKWEKNTGYGFPKILVVCPNEIIQNFLAKYIPQVLEEEVLELDFYLTTKELIRSTNLNKNIWQSVKL